MQLINSFSLTINTGGCTTIRVKETRVTHYTYTYTLLIQEIQFSSVDSQ